MSEASRPNPGDIQTYIDGAGSLRMYEYNDKQKLHQTQNPHSREEVLGQIGVLFDNMAPVSSNPDAPEQGTTDTLSDKERLAEHAKWQMKVDTTDKKPSESGIDAEDVAYNMWLSENATESTGRSLASKIKEDEAKAKRDKMRDFARLEMRVKTGAASGEDSAYYHTLKEYDEATAEKVEAPAPSKPNVQAPKQEVKKEDDLLEDLPDMDAVIAGRPYQESSKKDTDLEKTLSKLHLGDLIIATHNSKKWLDNQDGRAEANQEIYEVGTKALEKKLIGASVEDIEKVLTEIEFNPLIEGMRAIYKARKEGSISKEAYARAMDIYKDTKVSVGNKLFKKGVSGKRIDAGFKVFERYIRGGEYTTVVAPKAPVSVEPRAVVEEQLPEQDDAQATENRNKGVVHRLKVLAGRSNELASGLLPASLQKKLGKSESKIAETEKKRKVLKGIGIAAISLTAGLVSYLHINANNDSHEHSHDDHTHQPHQLGNTPESSSSSTSKVQLESVMEAELERSGDNIWNDAKDYLIANNLPSDDIHVDMYKDQILTANPDLSEENATKMPLGAKYTMPAPKF